MRRKTLFIVGAGPKAMAIAAKVTVLESLGFAVPEVHIVEKCAVGAHWSGLGGYTNGKMELGTSPEKDVGFPYRSDFGRMSARVDAAMQAFSWQAFQIQQGHFSQWVDRGRPSPSHALWARYLLWVSENLGPSVHIHYGKVDRIMLKGDAVNERWATHFQTDRGSRTLESDGLLLTGPGKIRKLPAAHPRILDVESFWKQLPNLREPKLRIGIVGAGENAASIALALSQCPLRRPSVEIVSPSGFVFSRGESYRENRVYSDPEAGRWDELSLRARREFMRRTDLGVFSHYALGHLDGVDEIEILPGRLVGFLAKDDTRVHAKIESHRGTSERSYDYLVMATGFDLSETLMGFIDEPTRQRLCRKLQVRTLTQAELELRIGPDLSIEDCTPRLHLPGLAGLMQGPGFANLSSLGRLADRVLHPYVVGKENYEIDNEFNKSADSGFCEAGK